MVVMSSSCSARGVTVTGVSASPSFANRAWRLDRFDRTATWKSSSAPRSQSNTTYVTPPSSAVSCFVTSPSNRRRLTKSSSALVSATEVAPYTRLPAARGSSAYVVIARRSSHPRRDRRPVRRHDHPGLRADRPALGTEQVAPGHDAAQRGVDVGPVVDEVGDRQLGAVHGLLGPLHAEPHVVVGDPR